MHCEYLSPLRNDFVTEIDSKPGAPQDLETAERVFVAWLGNSKDLRVISAIDLSIFRTIKVSVENEVAMFSP